jgi:hypothetical protein
VIIASGGGEWYEGQVEGEMIPMTDMALNYHLMHPGGDSMPGDPNAAFCLDGIYHLHYILEHLWKGTSESVSPALSPTLIPVGAGPTSRAERLGEVRSDS